MANQDVEYYRRIITTKPATVLIVGCGTGEDAARVRQLLPHANITALEPSKTSVAIARKNLKNSNITIVNTMMEAWKPSLKYDLVICSGVLHHTKDPANNLKLLSSWLNKTGRLIVGVYHHARWENRIERKDFHKYARQYSIAQLMDGSANPREKTYSWGMFLHDAKMAGLVPEKTGHRLPVPHGRVWCVLYDALFIYARQQMMLVRFKRVKTSVS